MFDEVTKREGGRRAARKGAYLAGSTTFQVAFIAALIVVSDRIRASVQSDTVVDVKFVKQAAPPPPPPPPPAPPKKKSEPRPPDAPKPRPPPPMAMIQPKQVQEEIKLPDPNTKPEPEPEYEGDGEGSSGVVGGVVGAGGGLEEAPVYYSAGYSAAREKERGCVSRAVRIPRDLQGIVTNVSVKFALRPGGRITDFLILGNVPDKRIEQAIWQAISSCQWVVANDSTGKQVPMWVILPLRFQQG